MEWRKSKISRVSDECRAVVLQCCGFGANGNTSERQNGSTKNGR